MDDAPPLRALAWAADAIGDGASVLSVGPVDGDTYRLEIRDASGHAHRCLMRLVTDPARCARDPRGVAREAGVLEALEGTAVPSPSVLALDPGGAHAGAPAWLALHPPGEPAPITAATIPHLAALLGLIREAPVPSRAPARTGERLAGPPPWSRRPEAWRRLISRASGAPPAEPQVLVHGGLARDRLLWSAGRITGLTGWANAGVGSGLVDLAHLRLSLALGPDPELAEALASAVAATGVSLSGLSRFDARATVDAIDEVDAGSRARLERWATALASEPAR